MLIETLRETAAALQARGITPTAALGEILPTSCLDELERSFSIVLPDELRHIYVSVGDGLHLSWEHDEMFGMFDLPPAADVLKKTRRFRANVAEFANDLRSLDRCVEPEHRPKAFEIWTSMKSWLPIHEEANGDSFCIRTEDGAVVYDQHDWFDGFGDVATTNGIVAGLSLTEFVVSWSRFFFTCPKSMWWGEFGKRGRIDWDPALFHSDYVRR